MNPPHTPLLESCEIPEAIGSYLKAERESLHELARSGAPGIETARKYSDLVDSVIRQMVHTASGFTFNA